MPITHIIKNVTITWEEEEPMPLWTPLNLGSALTGFWDADSELSRAPIGLAMTVLRLIGGQSTANTPNGCRK